MDVLSSHTADRGISHPPPSPPPPSFPLLTSSSTLSVSSPASSRSSSSRRRLLFLLVFFLSLSFSCVLSFLAAPLPPYLPQRDDDQTSAITLLLFASRPLLFFAPLPITLFLLLSALREDFDALSAKGGASAHCSFNQERCTREARQLVATFLDSNIGGCNKEFILSSFLFFLS